MKKTISFYVACLLVCGMVFSFVACSNTQNSTAGPVTTPGNAADSPAQTPPGSEESLSPDEGAAAGIPETEIDPVIRQALNDLQPVYDSIMRAMREMPELQREYDGQDDAFIWSVLYYLCTNYASSYPGTEIQGGEVKVPETLMMEFAAACFGDNDGLPLLKEEHEGIRYDPDAQAYFVVLSDAGDDYVEPVDYTITDNGFEATVAWLSHGSEEQPDMLGAFGFVIGQNAYAANPQTENPIFTLSVWFAFEKMTDTVFVKEVYERDGNTYAKIDKIFLQFHGAEDVDQDGKPYGHEWWEIINTEDTLEECLISKTAEFSFQAFDELFPGIDMQQATENPLAFFMENATLTESGTNIVFDANIYNGVLYQANYRYDFYVVG